MQNSLNPAFFEIVIAKILKHVFRLDLCKHFLLGLLPQCLILEEISAIY